MSTRAVVIGFDFEDWHQIVRRRLGDDDWDRPSHSFREQLEAVLALLDGMGARVTFFVLGMTAKHYPDLLVALVERGHEIACHGYAHVPVWTQTPEQFRDDLVRSLDLIEALCGSRPIGYRAPIFSIDRRASWAWEIIAEAGLRYDASLHDTPRLHTRLANIPSSPFILELPSDRSLFEFPVTVGRLGGRPVPIGGGTYWRVLPLRLIVNGLRAHAATGGQPTLYFHPYEFGAQKLRLGSAPRSLPRRAQALYRSARVNFGRGRVATRIRTIATEFRLVSHRRACEELLEHGRLRSTPLPEEGRFL